MKTNVINLKTFLSIIFILTGLAAFAQNGALRGNIIDDQGEPIMDVNVVIPELNKGGVTDWEGNYYIPNIPAGTYDVLMNVIGYAADTIKNVVVTPGEPVELNNSMVPEGDDLLDLDIVVVGTKVTGTSEAVIEEVKEAEEVVTAVSAEQISKSQDRSAADVMRRIPGATIIDDRFVMVRGLVQRYNTVMLNGVIAPSTEPDSRAFSLDIVPSRLMDRMLIFKSGSPDLPGDFAGAVVKIYTRSVVPENFLKVGITAGYRHNTTFRDFTKPVGSSTDFLGFDNGDRDLPSAFPDENLRIKKGFTAEEQAALASTWPETWDYSTSSARPDIRLSMDYGRNWEIGAKKITNLTSLSYSNTFQFTESDVYRYDNYNEELGRSNRFSYFNDKQYVNKVSSSIIHNWRFQLNGKNIIEFRNLFNQRGENEFVFREGEIGPIENPTQERRDYALHYTSRRLYSGQLAGIHEYNTFGKHTDFNWVIGYSNVKRSEPDYRRARTSRDYGSESPFSVVVPFSATTQDAARFYSTLNENTFSLASDFVTKLAKNDSVNIEIKYGIYGEYKYRDFGARWFSYTRNGSFDTDLQNLPIQDLFVKDNVYPNGGLLLSEGTNFTDEYSANYKYGAAYVGTSLPFGKLKVNGGFRGEIFNQQLSSVENNYDPIEVDSVTFSPLPFLNASYSFSDKKLFRLAYSKTVNRPFFREIAPFAYYDFVNQVDLVGNPDLVTANIHNIDARYEIYPTKSEFIAFGGFYKYFKNPIETILGGSGNPVFSFANASSAYNFGAEIEIRKSLLGLTSSSFINNLSLLFNGALVYSQIDLGDQVIGQEQTRPLQGQSPYVINTGLYYNTEDGDWSVSLLYNVFGNRIFLVGDNDNATVYELARNSVDLTITREFSERLRAVFGIKDLLNAKYRFYQDSDSNGKITEVDEPWREYRKGQYVTLGFAYKW